MDIHDDPRPPSNLPDRDPAHGRDRSRYVGSGRGLTFGVVAAIILLLATLLASTLWLADTGWRWWRAPVPTKLTFDPDTAPAPIRPVTPRGSQGAWFSSDSYPAAARRAGEEGRVSVKLLVEPNGTPSACEVVASSGSASLDAGTCRVAVRNGRFDPALGQDGQPMRGVFVMRNVVWRLED